MVNISPQLQVSATSFKEYRVWYQSTHRNVWTRRTHVVGTALAAVAALLAAIQLDVRLMLSSIAAGYAICWGADAIIEQRRPPSLEHPIWAFQANMEMVRDVIRGKETV